MLLLLLLLLLLLRDESTNFVCRFSSPALAKYHIFYDSKEFQSSFFCLFLSLSFLSFLSFLPLDAKKE